MERELFPGIQPGEKIYIVVREHWVLLALKLLVWLVMVVIGIAFHQLAPTYVPALFEGQSGTVISVFSKVYALFLTAYVFLIFVLYYLNIHIITSERIVDIDQEGIFHHKVAELHIDKMEDATSEVKGIMGTMFGYGNVYIQTAGARERFDFENVPDPDQLVKIILDLYAQRPHNRE